MRGERKKGGLDKKKRWYRKKEEDNLKPSIIELSILRTHSALGN